MRLGQVKALLLLLLSCFCFTSHIWGYAQSTDSEKHLKISLRIIGHQILLNSGDSTSRVLPVEKEEERYLLSFESDFAFNPSLLVGSVNSVIKESELSKNYIVEVVNCNGGSTVYSYEVSELDSKDIIPCGGRLQPKSCYQLVFTFLDLKGPSHYVSDDQASPGKYSSWSRYLMLASVGIIVLVLWFFWRRRKNGRVNPNLIRLGEFSFDKINNVLILNDQQNELTSKEADLLMLLYKDANSTVEREVILNRVWGDEGDYVGRTLDVFISKLRKKLEVDSKVRIVNVRGIGYKLVLNH